MNSKNVLGGGSKVKPELLCALCQSILVDPWECKECHNRFHQVCLNKFAKETYKILFYFCVGMWGIYKSKFNENLTFFFGSIFKFKFD